jgi:hypothetical protein
MARWRGIIKPEAEEATARVMERMGRMLNMIGVVYDVC